MLSHLPLSFPRFAGCQRGESLTKDDWIPHRRSTPGRLVRVGLTRPHKEVCFRKGGTILPGNGLPPPIPERPRSEAWLNHHALIHERHSLRERQCRRAIHRTVLTTVRVGTCRGDAEVCQATTGPMAWFQYLVALWKWHLPVPPFIGGGYLLKSEDGWI